MTVTALPNIPLVEPGDDLASILTEAVRRLATPLHDGDVVIVAQKIVSKAEGRQVVLDHVTPGKQARELAAQTEKDPRLVQLILDESQAVVRYKPGVLLVRHRLGHVCAHAGIDQSNIDHAGRETALLLPLDPDASARHLHEQLSNQLGVKLGVIIADSMNRPWRLGTVGAAIGCAGVVVLDDRRGGKDLFGRELKVTLINRADSIAAAATLLMGETTEMTPATLAQGLHEEVSRQSAAEINRPLGEDLFR